METKFYSQLGETVCWDRLPNGLTTAVVPRPGFAKKMCYFVTDFGAIHTDFTLEGEHFRVPDGIAHYLEHKMFDLPDRDVTAEFAALGAVPNAFTSYDMTAYYFSCTQNFCESLRLLLEFVSTPYFTKESVQKEQGIIGQEIGMNEDNPDSKVFDLLMAGMYAHHPVQVPILGTKKSIAEITPETLYKCHNAFYRPGNMLLVAVGDIDPQEVRQLAMEILPEEDLPEAQAVRSWDEPMTCKKHLETASMEVSMPMFQLGFKCEPADRGQEAIRAEMVGELAAEALFGESSPLYLSLYQQGLIDSSFGGGYDTVEGMAMLSAAGDSNSPEQVRDAIIAYAQQLVREGIPEKDFLRMKRSAMGRRIRALDSFDSICFRISAYYFSGFDYFDFPAIYESITVQELQELLQRAVDPERMSMCIINPINQEDKP